MQPCWCNHLDATILMLPSQKSHKLFPPSGLLPLILLPWHHLCRLSLLPSLLTLLLTMPSRCWQRYISWQVNQPWIHSWRLRHGNVGSIPGNIVGFMVTCANMLPTFPIKCYMLFQCRYCHCCHRCHRHHSCHCRHILFQCYFSSIHSPFLHCTHYHRQWKKHVWCNNPQAVGQKIFNNQLIWWFWQSDHCHCHLSSLLQHYTFYGRVLFYAFMAFSFWIYSRIYKPFSLDWQCLIQSICPGWCTKQLFSGLHWILDLLPSIARAF